MFVFALIFGANDSKYDVGGITYVTWETSKEEYTLNLEYDTNDADDDLLDKYNEKV